jgi:hypothetical protein
MYRKSFDPVVTQVKVGEIRERTKTLRNRIDPVVGNDESLK